MEIADGDDFGILVREERVEHLVAAIAQADEADTDAVICAEDPARAQGGHGNCRAGRCREIPAGNLRHGCLRESRDVPNYPPPCHLSINSSTCFAFGSRMRAM